MALTTVQTAAHLQQDLCSDVTALIHQLMSEKHVSRRELARRLEMPEYRLSKLLESGELTLSGLACMLGALGERAYVGRKYHFNEA